MKDLDQLKLRTIAKFLELVADGELEPATVDINDVFVDDNGILRTYLKGIPLVPELKLAMVEFSIEDYLNFEYRGTKFDTIKDIQDAHFNLYGLEEDELESVRDDVSRPMQERAHATLMFARDSFVINRCSCCGFYYDNMSYGIICPHCDHRHTEDFPVTRVDEYGRIVS